MVEAVMLHFAGYLMKIMWKMGSHRSAMTDYEMYPDEHCKSQKYIRRKGWPEDGTDQ